MKKEIYTLFILALLSFTLPANAQNMGLTFDGTDDYIITSSSMNLSGSAISMEAWIYAESFESSSPFITQILGTENDSNGAFLRLGDADIDKDKIQFVLLFGGSQTKLTSTSSLSINTWYHIVGTYDGANMRIFINGDEDALAAQTGSFTSNAIFSIAVKSDDQTRNFDGKMDEIRIWSDARSEVEIRANMYKELAGTENNLVAYYKLNETSGTNANDSQTSSTYDGTLTNMDNSDWVTSSAFFGPKNCLDFDASSDYGQKSSNVTTATDNFTMMAWIKADEVPSDQWRCIAYNGNDGGGYGIGMVNGKLGGLFGTIAFHETTAALSTGEWYHVTMRRSSGTTEFFLNGKLLSYSNTTAPNSPSNRFSIGNMYNSSDAPLYATSFDGQIDEVKVYDAALTDAQIQEVMFKTLEGDESNLVAYYNFDNTSGTKLQSFDGSTANDLTLVAMSDDDWVTSTAINTWLNTNSTAWATAANWSRGSVPASSDNVGVYNYSGSSPALSGIPTIDNLYVGSSSNLTLGSNATINGNLFLYDDLDLNGKTVTLGSSAHLYETSSAHISGSSGLIQTTRDLSDIDEDVAGLGLKITEDGNLGSSTIKRSHSTSGITSVNRQYQITTENSPTSATMVFNYLTDELNSQTEADLKLWKSSNGTSSWAEQTSTVSTANNTITITSLNSFSYWTGATKTAPVVTTTSISSITTTTASGGGNVTSNGNQSVTAKGVCWNTSTNPTTANSTTSNGTGTGSFTSSITGLSASTTYYVRAYATNATGTSYGSSESFTTTFTSTTWNGSTWSNGAPTSTIDAIIDGTYNDGANFVCDDLTINSGKALTLGSGKTITVNGNLSVSGSFTIASGGSLITEGSISGNVTIKKIISDTDWHLISVPNVGTTANAFFGDYLEPWDETTGTWSNIEDKTTALNPVQGYGFKKENGDGSHTFTGTPNTGNQEIEVTYTEIDGKGYDGANLLGNPYPSSIDWANLDGTWGAVYYWDGSAEKYVSWNNDSGSGSQFIPPMQGFFIVTSSSGTTFSLSNTNRSHMGATAFYKSEKTLSNSLILTASNGASKDELHIAFDESSSNEFELNRDAYKFLSGTNGQSQLYSFTEETKFSIDVRPEEGSVQLGFKNDKDGVYQIGLKEMEGISGAFLEDTKLSIFHNLENSDYQFEWNTTDSEKRFKFHTSTTATDDLQNDILQIYAHHKTIYIQSNEMLKQASVSLVDIMGRVVFEKQINNTQSETIQLDIADGVYTLVIISELGKQSKKIILN